MFTDELMEQKYNETHNIHEVLVVLLKSVLNADNKEHENSNVSIPAVKICQANNISKLFASRHSEVKADGFKNVLLKYFPEKTDYINSILK